MVAAHTPLVSVVMATCDRAHFLESAIGSVLGQEIADLELIIADDGSAEAARRTLHAWESDPRVRVLWLPHRGIPGAVRNAGLHAARGRYIAFQDSDDVWLPDKLTTQLEALAARPGVRWCYTACEYIDARGVAIERPQIQPWRAHEGAILDAVACLRAHAALPTVLAERQLLMETGFFDERLGLFEDHDLWLRLACRSEVAVAPRPLVKVRRHDEHYSGRDALAAAECRAIFLDRAWLAPLSRAARAELRRIRALQGGRVARLRALAGDRSAARDSLRHSLRGGWRYARWWIDAAHVFLDARSMRVAGQQP
jgi:glycosyltransferase involved in cell wall biosynthesis